MNKFEEKEEKILISKVVQRFKMYFMGDEKMKLFFSKFSNRIMQLLLKDGISSTSDFIPNIISQIPFYLRSADLISSFNSLRSSEKNNFLSSPHNSISLSLNPYSPLFSSEKDHFSPSLNTSHNYNNKQDYYPLENSPSSLYPPVPKQIPSPSTFSSNCPTSHYNNIQFESSDINSDNNELSSNTFFSSSCANSPKSIFSSSSKAFNHKFGTFNSSCFSTEKDLISPTISSSLPAGDYKNLNDNSVNSSSSSYNFDSPFNNENIPPILLLLMNLRKSLRKEMFLNPLNYSYYSPLKSYTKEYLETIGLDYLFEELYDEEGNGDENKDDNKGKENSDNRDDRIKGSGVGLYAHRFAPLLTVDVLQYGPSCHMDTIALDDFN
jgi:hypothetical protein